MKRKFIKIITVLLLVAYAGAINASAARVGDIIGAACYTDIVATINGYDVASFNVGGYTYVVAEDLRNYGFDVSWDPYTRTLGVTRNPWITSVASTYAKPYVAPYMVGQISHNILYTDIVTYVNGYYVNSYNINGQTIIAFGDLAGFGQLTWHADQKKIALVVPGLESKGTSVEELENFGYKYKTEYNIQDNYSNFYSKALDPYIKMEYLLNGQYSRFTATFFTKGDNWSTNILRIKADGKEIYRADLTYKSKPVNVDLDIRGCNEFSITFSEGYMAVAAYMYNATFR